MPSTLERLSAWYSLRCDGDWEHCYGIEIGTLDNPGWRVRIDLTETDLVEEPFDELRSEYEHQVRWLRCWKEGSAFHAAGGPEQLEAALQVFLAWAESRTRGPRAG